MYDTYKWIPCIDFCDKEHPVSWRYITNQKMSKLSEVLVNS